MPKQDVAVEVFYDGAWHDLVKNDDVLADTTITIVRGQGAEGASLRPCSIAFRLANDDDMYRISNPESPLYGKTGLNTPVQVAVAGVVRGSAAASAWVAAETQDFRPYPRRGKAWVDVRAGGLLQRIANWSDKLADPFTRFNEALPGIVGYWALTDAKGTTYAATTVPGSSSGPVRNLGFESQYRFPGSAPLADIDTTPVSTSGYFVKGNAKATAGWQVSWAQKITTFDPALTYSLFFWSTADGTNWSLSYSAGNWVIIGNNDDGTFPPSAPGGFALIVADTYNLGQAGWILFDVCASYSGGTTTIQGGYRGQNDNAFTVFSGTYGGPTSALASWSVTGLSLTDATIGHIIGVNADKTVLDLGSGDRWDAFQGHAGELAALRFARLCEEFNILYYVSANYLETTPMGPQPPDTLQAIFQEIVTTEDALLYDHRPELKLFFVGRYDRLNQPVTARLLVTDLPGRPGEVTDNLPAHNIVTASQRGGGSYTVSDDVSPLGTQDPPNGVGEARQTVDINIDDETTWLIWEAQWRLSLGTVNLPRYPQVVINLGALDAERIAAIENVDVGDVLTISGYREYVIRLWVLGYTETIGTHTRMITFTCAPDEIYGTAGVLDTVVLDSATTTLKTGLGRLDTAATFTTGNLLDVWDTAATPFDVTIAGQRCTVTAIGAASLVSGSYDQAATLRRGVNGINKTLGAGEEIHLAGTYGRLAL